MTHDESQNVEYKRSWHDDYLRWVCGFANGKGSLVQELDILNVPSDRRNGILADVFDRLDYMEREGSGFKKIVEDYTANVVHNTAKVMPKFYSAVGCFIVTLPRLVRDVQGDNQDVEGVGNGVGNLSEVSAMTTTQTTTQISMGTTTRQVLNLLKTEPFLSGDVAAQRMGLTRNGFYYHVKILRKVVGLKHVGGTKRGRWDRRSCIRFSGLVSCRRPVSTCI